MTTPPPPPEQLDLLERIAEVRATGASWEHTAKELATTVDELRALTKAHRQLFRRLSARADREVMREGMREAVFYLRKHMRNVEDPVESRKNAEELSQITLTFYRHRNKKTPIIGLDPEDPDVQEAVRYVEMKKSWTPEQWKRWAENNREYEFDRRLRERYPELFAKRDNPPEKPTDPDTGGNPVPRDPKPLKVRRAGAARQRSEVRSQRSEKETQRTLL
jgi:hypothetical protein